METVQLQCGHCQKVMAIGVEYLGGQVQCPHCKGIVQTPPRTPPAAAPAPVPNLELQQRESIFGGAEASDAVLGEAESPKVEMPGSFSAEAPVSPVRTPEQLEAPSEEAQAEFTKFKPRPVYDRGVFAMYAIIFLVPYAILSTLAILYLLFMRPAPPHPLDVMPDPQPRPDKGGVKIVTRTSHKHPLAEHQKVALGKSVRVGKDGFLLATPEKIRWTEHGDLQLLLRAKNISANTVFDPINEMWVKLDPNKGITEQYTHLESKTGSIANIYGADLGYRKNAKDEEEAGSALLRPDQETTIVLTTYSSNKLVPEIAKASDTFTWRVQLRRGFVKHRDKDVSTTAVIGVVFTPAEIEGKRG